jgi:hypothetical protein
MVCRFYGQKEKKVFTKCGVAIGALYIALFPVLTHSFYNFKRKYPLFYDLLTVDLDIHCDLADLCFKLECIMLPSCILFTKLYVFEEIAKFDLYDL